jgi:hypothetical protein
VAVPVQGEAEFKVTAIVVSVVKAVEPAEVIGVPVPVQDVVEPRVAATVVSAVKAVEPVEAIGAFVTEPNMVEATVAAMLITLFRRIEKEAVEKTRTSVVMLHTLQQGGITHLAADGIRRTLCRLLSVKTDKTVLAHMLIAHNSSESKHQIICL